MARPATARIRVRAFRRGDVKAVARLARALNRHQGDPASSDIAAALVRDALGPRPFVRVVVATLGERIVGYALYALAYETSYATRGLYLNDLYVAPRARRQGVARAILAAVARRGAKRGATFIWWTSRPWNRDAHRFYAALGARMEPVFAHALTHDAFAALAGRPSRAPKEKRIAPRERPGR